MGWNEGTMQITSFATSAGCHVDVLKVMAKLARPLSSLHVRGSLSLGESIPRPTQSRITQ
jgi:hypothetical protein